MVCFSLRTNPSLVGLEDPWCLFHAYCAPFLLAHYPVSQRLSFNSPYFSGISSPTPGHHPPASSRTLLCTPPPLHCRTHQHLKWPMYVSPPYCLPHQTMALRSIASKGAWVQVQVWVWVQRKYSECAINRQGCWERERVYGKKKRPLMWCRLGLWKTSK